VLKLLSTKATLVCELSDSKFKSAVILSICSVTDISATAWNFAWWYISVPNTKSPKFCPSKKANVSKTVSLSVKPGTHCRQSWMQHGWLCWKSTKSTVSLWPRTHWLQSRPFRQQSRPRQAVEFMLLPICCQNRQLNWTYTVDFVVDFLQVSATVDFQQSQPYWIQLCHQCVPGLTRQLERKISSPPVESFIRKICICFPGKW